MSKIKILDLDEYQIKILQSEKDPYLRWRKVLNNLVGSEFPSAWPYMTSKEKEGF